MYHNRHLAILFLLALGLVFSGCESDDDSGEEIIDETTAEDTDEGSDTHPNFPDGLHPDSEGDQIIASVYSRFISPQAGATVVCIGDSITAGGYPGPLAGITGMNVVDAGVSGEKSDGGLSRVNALLEQYRPTYLCILYGANDIIGAHWPPETTVANLSGIVSAARAYNCTPIVGTLTPMSGDKYGEYADEARATSAAIRGMGGAIADLEAAF